MALIKYTGLSHYRELLESDFQKVDVKVKGALVFARNEVTKVSDEVANALMKLVGVEFAKVKDDTDEAVRDLTTKDPTPPAVVAPATTPPVAPTQPAPQAPTSASTPNMPA